MSTAEPDDPKNKVSKKTSPELSKVQKAAIFVSTLSQETASEFLEKMEPPHASEILVTSLTLAEVEEEVRFDVVREFFNSKASSRLKERVELHVSSFPQRALERVQELWFTESDSR